MLNGPKSPREAYDNIVSILGEYISAHANNTKSWHEIAGEAKSALVQKYSGIPFSFDQLKSYVKDELAPLFRSPVKKVMFLEGNSSLMQSLMTEIERWPTQEQYLTAQVSQLLKENETLQGNLLHQRSLNLQQARRIEALELEIAELKQLTHQDALNEASRIGSTGQPFLVNRATVLTPPPSPNHSPVQEAPKTKKPQ
ncbi:MAG: hypothetical protein AB7I18_00480 [Candidatus Berkiella sp.]